MKILSIETSCDETAVAIINATGKETDALFQVEGDALYSQASKHAQYGGVYPTLAKREHARNLVPLLKSALKEASLLSNTEHTISKEKQVFIEKLLYREDGLAQKVLQALQNIEKPSIDAIAVTYGPGLEPALWVGVNFARALAHIWDIPIIPVNHLEGHMIASAVHSTSEDGRTFAVQEVAFPMLGLIISGGHTEIVHTTEWGSYAVIGSTRDDSIGEAFDKVARILDVPYPGGPRLSELAQEGRNTLSTRPAHLTKNIQKLPRPMIRSNDLDFSFSGIKTAVLYMVQGLGEVNNTQRTLIAAEFEEAVTDVLLTKVTQALELHPSKTFILGGGVSANTYIKERLQHLFKEEIHTCTLRVPTQNLSTDNAVMIGMTGYFMHLRNEATYTSTDTLSAIGNLKLQ